VKTIILRIVCVIGILVGLGVHAAIFGYAGNTATKVTLVGISEDRFYNYDFRSNGSTSKSNVDWPVMIVFNKNANVNKVKNAFWGSTAIGNNMYARMTDDINAANSWVWDSDRGTKTGACTSGQIFRHMRVYGPPDGDRMYNPSWGYYVLATTHYDREECLSTKQFGWSETAEEYMTKHIENKYIKNVPNPTWSISRDYMNLFNPESARWEGNNFWHSDGRATFIRVP